MRGVARVLWTCDSPGCGVTLSTSANSAARWAREASWQVAGPLGDLCPWHAAQAVQGS